MSHVRYAPIAKNSCPSAIDPIVAVHKLSMLRRMKEMRRKLPLVLLIPFLVITACGVDSSSDLSDPWGREPDPALAPVTDVDAAIVKELFREGYLIVDQRETGCDAGPDVHCDGFSALYLGRDNEAGEESAAEFACPGTKAPVDQWRCRRLDPPYVPNGGFKPEPPGGS